MGNENIEISMTDFLVVVGVHSGITIDTIKENCRQAMLAGDPFTIFVGPDKKYVISLDSLKKYFDITAKPKPASVPVQPAEEYDFLKSDEVKKSGGKR